MESLSCVPFPLFFSDAINRSLLFTARRRDVPHKHEDEPSRGGEIHGASAERGGEAAERDLHARDAAFIPRAASEFHHFTSCGMHPILLHSKSTSYANGLAFFAL